MVKKFCKLLLLSILSVFSILLIINFVSTEFIDDGTSVQNVTECGMLNTTNATYTLNQSISSSFDCLIINATNITLDCAGYNITYGNATGGFGIAVVDQDTPYDDIPYGFYNATIKNCLIIQNESGADETAIFFGNGSENGVVYNNTIIVYGDETNGITVGDNSINVNISLNNITTSGNEARGIVLWENESNANISSNTVTTFGEDSSGIVLEVDSVSVNISLNSITTSGTESYGIVLWERGSNANISSNTVTTSGEDSSGIVMGDTFSSGLIFNNTINTSGDWSASENTTLGGIWLESNTVDINVSTNTITMSGYNTAGIWVGSCSNHSIEDNVINSSGESGDGMFLAYLEGVNVTSNTINITGNLGDGIYSYSSEEPLLFYNNVITTSGTYYSYGINLNQDSNSNISLNNITTSGAYSYGIFSNQSHNNTIESNRVTTGQSSSYVLHLTTSGNQSVYNNLFNTSTTGSGIYINDSNLNYFNTSDSLLTNIIGKDYFGGNFWTNNNGDGYSDYCANIYDNYYCDSSYRVVEGVDSFDYLPLTNYQSNLSVCEDLNVKKRYILNTSLSLNGTCFNITANGVFLDFAGFNITGNMLVEGVNVTNYNNTKIINGLIYNFSHGVFLNNSQDNNITNITFESNNISLYIESSPNNTFSDITLNNSGQNCVYLIGTASSNNNFTDVIVENTIAPSYDIEFATEGINGTWIIDSLFTSYAFAGFGGLVNFRISGYALVEFLEPINGSGTSLTLSDVNLDNNLLYVNSSSNSGLNKSAKITFYSISYIDPKPQYSSDNVIFTDCTSSTDPSCNEVSYTGTTFVFNVSHFTYFRAAEAYIAPDGTASPGGRGGATSSFWNRTYVINDSQFKQGYTKDLSVRNRIQVKINNSKHYLGVVELTSTTAKINVSSSPQQATFLIGDTRRFDVTEDGYYDILVILNGINEGKANITISSIFEKVTEETEKEEQDKETGTTTEGGEKEEIEEKEGLKWWGVLLIILAVIVVFCILYLSKKKSRKFFKKQ